MITVKRVYVYIVALRSGTGGTGTRIDDRHAGRLLTCFLPVFAVTPRFASRAPVIQRDALPASPPLPPYQMGWRAREKAPT